ncbi:unnamed protein product, partial [Staurois parvus]
MASRSQEPQVLLVCASHGTRHAHRRSWAPTCSTSSCPPPSSSLPLMLLRSQSTRPSRGPAGRSSRQPSSRRTPCCTPSSADPTLLPHGSWSPRLLRGPAGRSRGQPGSRSCAPPTQGSLPDRHLVSGGAADSSSASMLCGRGGGASPARGPAHRAPPMAGIPPGFPASRGKGAPCKRSRRGPSGAPMVALSSGRRGGEPGLKRSGGLDLRARGRSRPPAAGDEPGSCKRSETRLCSQSI